VSPISNHAISPWLILTVVTLRARLEPLSSSSVFRRQQHDRFRRLVRSSHRPPPPAVAAAQYHFSPTDRRRACRYMLDDRKAWIRYPPPRWIWKGTAILAASGRSPRARCCRLDAIRVSRSIISTSASSAQAERRRPGRARKAIYYDYDHPLEPDHRLVFAAIRRPQFDPRRAGPFRSQAGQTAIEKILSQLCMEYVRTPLLMVPLFGAWEDSVLSAASHRQLIRH